VPQQLLHLLEARSAARSDERAFCEESCKSWKSMRTQFKMEAVNMHSTTVVFKMYGRSDHVALLSICGISQLRLGTDTRVYGRFTHEDKLLF